MTYPGSVLKRMVCAARRGFAGPALSVLLALSAALAVLATAGVARAVDDSQSFLEALRNQGYNDIALEYIAKLQSAPNLSDEQKRQLNYEAALVLIEAAQRTASRAARDEQLGEARQRLNQVLAQSPDSPLAPTVREKLADVLVARSQLKMDQAEQQAKTPEEKQRLLAEARPFLEEAEQLYGVLATAAEEHFKTFPKVIPKTDTALTDARSEAYNDVLFTRLMRINIAFESAKTYPPGSDARQAQMTKVAGQYNEYSATFGRFLAAMNARLGEARCNNELGKQNEAFSIVEELLSESDEPASQRQMKNDALLLALEMSLPPGAPRQDDVIKWFRHWRETSKGNEESTTQGLAIQCLAGEVLLAKARTLKGNDAEQRELLKQARQALDFVKRFPGVYQQRAALALQNAPSGGDNAAAGPASPVAAAQLPPPKTFAEAREQADRAQEQVTNLTLASRLSGNDADTAASREQLRQAQRAALIALRTALDMAPPTLSVDDLNTLRYQAALAGYTAADYEVAAVLSEFLAGRYPNSVVGRPSAQLALAAYAALYNDADPAAREFARRKMIDTAEYIVTVWPNEREAGQAWNVLISAAVLAGDLPQARQYLERIGNDSPYRGDAELLLGQAMWGNYLKAARALEGGRPSPQELEKMLAETKAALESGIQRMQDEVAHGKEIDYPLAAAALSLAQIDLQTAQAGEALKLLEEPRYGPLTLVQAHSGAVSRPNFAAETYKTALRAYVATQQTNKALETMQQLEAEIHRNGNDQAGASLTRVYIGLGRELQEQLNQLRNDNKRDEAAAVAQGFEVFLNKILERDKGNDFTSLNWVAETFANLGAGVDAGGATLDAKAAEYYRRAADTYSKLLARLEEPGFGAPAGAADSLKLRLGRCQRKLGDYKAAMTWLLEVLKSRPTMLDAQVEAAETYQDWGATQPEYYQLAISGSPTYREIWGWGQLARRVQAFPQYRETFHRARYNIALCRMKLAETHSGDERKKLLDAAEKDILVVYRLYPDLGGPEWYAKYDDLLKTIQRLRGDGSAAGLPPPEAASR